MKMLKYLYSREIGLKQNINIKDVIKYTTKVKYQSLSTLFPALGSKQRSFTIYLYITIFHINFHFHCHY
jgi:hypothetical protein